MEKFVIFDTGTWYLVVSMADGQQGGDRMMMQDSAAAHKNSSVFFTERNRNIWAK